MSDLQSQLTEEFMIIGQRHAEASRDAKRMLAMLEEQTDHLARLGAQASATFYAIKTHVQGDAQIPTLVLLEPKGAPAWKGAWYDNITDNVFKQFKSAIGSHKYFQLRFLCERTLLPTPGLVGYEMEVTDTKLREFVENLANLCRPKSARPRRECRLWTRTLVRICLRQSLLAGKFVEILENGVFKETEAVTMGKCSDVG